MEPRDVILADLTGAFNSAAREEALARASGRSAPVPFVSHGGERRGADPASVRFLKEGGDDGYRLHAVSWTAGDGQRLEGVFALRRLGDEAWTNCGVHWGSQGGDPKRGRPWVNFGCGGQPLYFAGKVCEAPSARRVRIMSGDHHFEDLVDDTRWVLFPTRLDNRAMHDDWLVELLDAGGAVIATHRLGGRTEPL